MASLSQRSNGAAAVCASAGNLGQALAYSGARRGIPVTVVAAQNANPLKIDRMRTLGATVRLTGGDIEDARLLARGIAEDEDAYLVEDSLDLSSCEGAGTIGLELLGRAEELDTLVIALGGGALASGVGYVAKSLAPDVEVVAVQPERAPAMALSWRSGRVVETESIDTIADGVAGRCPIPEVLDDLLVILDDVALVSEAAIKTGMQLLYQHAGLVVEPSAALGVATVLEDRERFAGRRVGTIVCGSNVVSTDFERWVLSPP
jgi:threonine dehydratase